MAIARAFSNVNVSTCLDICSAKHVKIPTCCQVRICYRNLECEEIPFLERMVKTSRKLIIIVTRNVSCLRHVKLGIR